MNSDPQSSPKEDPTTGESSLPSDPDTLEPDDKPSEKDSDEPEVVDDDIVPAANTGVTFIPAGNVPSGSTPTCELDPSACEDTRPPGAGVDICEIRPDLTQCQEPTPPPTETEPPTDPEQPGECELLPWLPQCDDDDDDDDGDGGNDNPGDPADTTAPEPVTLNECKVEWGGTSATVSWQPQRDDDGERLKGFTVGSPRGLDPSKTGPRFATYEGLDPSDTYTFWVTATDTSGNESDRSHVECVMDIQPPAMPAEVMVDEGDPSDSTLNVSWSESEDNENGVGDVTYNLYRNGQLVGPVNDTSYEDTGLEAGKTYTYSVEAIDGAGNKSARSAGVPGTTTKIAPTVPTGLKASGEGPLGFDLEWNQSTDEDKVTPDAEIDYRVSVSGGLCFGDTVNDATTYRVTCLVLWDTADVTVTAIDGDGNESAPSRVLTVNSDGSEARELNGNTTLRSNTPGEDKSDAPADKPGSPEAPAEDAPAEEQPTAENSPLLPGLDDILPGGDEAEAPAEEPAEPEASPSESESPAARPTTEEPADEATEDAPAEEDEGGLLENIGDALTSAVAAVF
ncbi:fibronectin type III domain-containing protein [Nocardioides sp. NPDC058538]|uniref:fibronectin type III domain-containing protein n=1 Tax=Nocardioides sp. NPDC058538 TaxID=3346542 RepID=UPI003664BE7F